MGRVTCYSGPVRSVQDSDSVGLPVLRTHKLQNYIVCLLYSKEMVPLRNIRRNGRDRKQYRQKWKTLAMKKL